jgi:hypothetical protein
MTEGSDRWYPARSCRELPRVGILQPSLDHPYVEEQAVEKASRQSFCITSIFSSSRHFDGWRKEKSLSITTSQTAALLRLS